MIPHSFKFSIKEAEDLLAEMARLRNLFLQVNGCDPSGFVLGPKEWLMFKTLIDDQLYIPSYKNRWVYDLFPNIFKFMGLDVQVKTTDGVELLINPKMAIEFIATNKND